VRGVAGAAVSFIGFSLPAFLLMIGLSAFYARSYTLTPVVAVFDGLQTIVVAIVANATVSFGKTSLKGFRDVFIGAVVATVSVFLPSFLMVIGVTPYFDKLRNSAYFYGVINPVVCSFVGLLLTVTFRFASNIPWDIFRVLLAAAAFVALLLKVEIIWIVLAGTVVSMFLL
jgi:chromate transporter